MEIIATALEADAKAIQVAPYEGKILSELVRLKNPTNVVEIGTLYGYSLSWILEGVGSQSKVWSVEKLEDNFAKSISFINTHNKASQANLVHSSGLAFLEKWNPSQKIDFLFIDADKGNYLNYLNLALPHLSKGAVVVGDNTFLFGHVLEDEPPVKYSKNTWAKMREFNEILGGSTGEFSGMMLPTLQGMTVGIKK
jgi:predicted O-methyltransferase YrrM